MMKKSLLSFFSASALVLGLSVQPTYAAEETTDFGHAKNITIKTESVGFYLNRDTFQLSKICRTSTETSVFYFDKEKETVKTMNPETIERLKSTLKRFSLGNIEDILTGLQTIEETSPYYSFVSDLRNMCLDLAKIRSIISAPKCDK